MQSPRLIYYHKLKNIPVPIQALCEAGLSPTQWTLLYLMAHAELEEEMLAMIHCPNKYLLWTNADLQDLLERFYLINEPHPDAPTKTDLMNFRVSERFTDLLSTLKEAWLPDGHYQLARPLEERRQLTAPTPPRAVPAPPLLFSTPPHTVPDTPTSRLDAFDELFQAYPSHIPVKGMLMSGRGGDYDTMAAAYAKALQRHGSSHLDILELVHWAKSQSPSLLTMGLQKFIASREWLGLQELRDQGFAGSSRK